MGWGPWGGRSGRLLTYRRSDWALGVGAGRVEVPWALQQVRGRLGRELGRPDCRLAGFHLLPERPDLPSSTQLPFACFISAHREKVGEREKRDKGQRGQVKMRGP